jgi:hypothetical protein
MLPSYSLFIGRPELNLNLLSPILMNSKMELRRLFSHVSRINLRLYLAYIFRYQRSFLNKMHNEIHTSHNIPMIYTIDSRDT